MPLFALLPLQILLIYLVFFGLPDRNNYKNDLCYKAYADKETLLSVMQEVTHNIKYRITNLVLTDHFILYEEKYDYIIRYCDINFLRKTSLSAYTIKIEIGDVFGILRSYNIKKELGEEIYNFLLEKCSKVDEIIKYQQYLDAKEFEYRPYPLTYDYMYAEDKKMVKDNKKAKKQDKKKESKKV